MRKNRLKKKIFVQLFVYPEAFACWFVITKARRRGLFFPKYEIEKKITTDRNFNRAGLVLPLKMGQRIIKYLQLQEGYKIVKLSTIEA